MTKEERVILANQYILMKRLGVDDDYEKKDLENKISILMQGWTYLYNDEILDVCEECEESIQEEVIDILDMYRSITYSIENLSNDEIESIPNRHYSVFRGFDGNEESKHYSFMNFLINKMKRFEEIEPRNSHTNVLKKYRSMLARYNEINNQKGMMILDLTIEELKIILE